MVYWITGHSRSGKSTLALTLKQQIPNSVVLECDFVRTIWGTKNYDYETIAKIALLLENGGHTVIMTSIGPIASEIKRIKKMFNECIEIPMPFGKDAKGREIR